MMRSGIPTIFFVSLFCIFAYAQAEAQNHPFKTKRCVNMGNALEAPREGEWGHKIDTAHFTRIRAVGFDTVRIPVRWADHVDQDGGYTVRPDFAARVDEVITAALAADLNVVLNIHHFEDMMTRPNANMDKFISIWAQLADRYKGVSDRLIFEVLNEPHTALKGDIMRRAQAAAIDVIRQTNPTRILILGGEHWSGVDTLGTNLATDDPNVIYTFHYYHPFEFTHQNAPWTGKDGPKRRLHWGSAEEYAELARDMAIAADVADKLGRPVFLGEFGAYEAGPQAARLRYTEAVRRAAEAEGLGWCVWNFTASFPIFDVPSQSWTPGYLQALGLRED